MGSTTEAKIRIEGKEARLSCPYHPDIVRAARSLNGRWNSSAREWVFDSRDTERIANTVRSVLGVFPNIEGEAHPSTTGDSVTIRVTVRFQAPNPLWGFGRLLAERRQRDLPVRLGSGVIVCQGEFPDSAGTRRTPELLGSWNPPVVIEVRDVPRSIADDNHAPQGCSWEIVVPEQLDRRAVLLAEREELLKRLAAIEDELRQLGVEL